MATDRAPTEGTTGPAATSGSTPVSVQLAILASEHANLASTRSMVWGEVFSRSAMYLTTLSAAIVSLALVAQNAGLRDQFGIFAILVLALVIFVGIATGLRLNSSNALDASCVLGMNRIRASYLRLAPELAPVFVMGTSDDQLGVARTMGSPGDDLKFAHFISATPIVIMIINSAVLGVFVGLIAGQVALFDVAILVLLGVVVFVIAIVAQLRIGQGFIRRQQRAFVPRFPSSEVSGS